MNRFSSKRFNNNKIPEKFVSYAHWLSCAAFPLDNDQ